MRLLHSPASLCLAAAALLAAAPPVRAEPPVALPSCVTDDGAFPLTTRLHGGPDSYTAGGGFGTWYLDLTNTTRRTCTGIHPVVVLVDGKRALKPSQPRLEFYGTPTGSRGDRDSQTGQTGENKETGETGRTGPDDARPLPVRFETTDQDELVGAFDGFPGFTVGPRKTITVKVRLAITSDTVPNEVTANAAVVQRHDGDGDWVGQSNDYRFTIDAEPADAADAADATAPADPDAPADRESSADPAASAVPNPSTSPRTGAAGNELSLADELARTGLISAPGATLAATTAFVLAGAALLLARRRR